MGVKNNGVCLHCRARSHESKDCNVKVSCPECHAGWRQCFMVEKDSPHKGKLFYTCTRKISNECNYWKLVGPPKIGDPDYEEGESSNAENLTEDFNSHNQTDDLSAMMDRCAHISETRNVDVGLKVYEFTFRKRQ